VTADSAAVGTPHLPSISLDVLARGYAYACRGHLEHRDFIEGEHRFYKALGYVTYSVSTARQLRADLTAR
jgi:hypothetical protein